LNIECDFIREGMMEFNKREYQTVILAALLHVNISRFIGDIGEGGLEDEKNHF